MRYTRLSKRNTDAVSNDSPVLNTRGNQSNHYRPYYVGAQEKWRESRGSTSTTIRVVQIRCRSWIRCIRHTSPILGVETRPNSYLKIVRKMRRKDREIVPYRTRRTNSVNVSHRTDISPEKEHGWYESLGTRLSVSATLRGLS